MFNGLCKQAWRSIGIALVDYLLTAGDVRVVRVNEDLFRESWRLYSSRADKEWSLTDCVSFVVMRREKIREAFTCDRHFEQAGFQILL